MTRSRRAGIGEASPHRLFVFGSYGRSAAPRDVDLLLVYSKGHCTVDEAISMRARIQEIVPRLVGLPVHIVLLSNDEERSVGFINAERCVPADNVFRRVLDANQADQVLREIARATQPGGHP
jgi:predicted nucleotidyltransferase